MTVDRLYSEGRITEANYLSNEIMADHGKQNEVCCRIDNGS